MSVTSAMFTGVSGLLNNAEAMNVIGNNIANVNTVGFKYGRTLFSDMLSAKIGNDSQVGRGVQLQTVENQFAQSSFETTENVTDVAIEGNSFFALGRPDGDQQVTAQNAAYLTRAGAFSVDKDLYLVNPDGYQVLDTTGMPIKFSDNADAIATEVATYEAGNTTDNALTDLNTDITNASVAIAAMPAGAAKTAASDLLTAAQNAYAAAVTANNNLTANKTAVNADTVASAIAATALATQDVAAAAGTAYSASPNVSATATAYASVSAEEGKAFSKVLSIDSNGRITYLGKGGTTYYYNTSDAVGVTTSPANSLTVNRVAIVSVPAPTALEKIGGTLFQATPQSGVSIAGFDLISNGANGITNRLFSNSLEQSNVDMAAQFVKMIITQRAYSANSKTITTTDEMTQEVLNLKR